MKRYLRLKFSLLVCLFLAPVISAQSSFYLKDGDRVVFYGDSITQQRLYSIFVEEYVLTRFPGLNIAFVHSGVGGDRVGGGAAGPIALRLKRDVIDYQPTVMTIMLGMNDGSYRAFDQTVFDRYSAGYDQIIRTVTSALPNLRLTLIQPSPYDDVTRPPGFTGGYNDVLKKYGEFIKETGAKHKFTVADLNTGVVTALEKAKSIDPSIAKLFIPDRIHPGSAGHWLMAGELLKAWNAPSIVSILEIDAESSRVIRSENTTISDLKVTTDELAWIQLDRALPLPWNLIDASIELAIKSSSLAEALNRQPLRIAGLKTGRYKLMIDDREIGAFSHDQLSGGINLALLRTPMLQQAMTVHYATEEHNNIHDTRFRLLVNSKDIEDSAGAVKAVDSLEALIVRKQRNNAQPKPHRFKITRLPE